jgi:hypothetical protein
MKRKFTLAALAALVLLGSAQMSLAAPTLVLPGPLGPSTNPGVVLSHDVNSNDATVFSATFFGLPAGLSVGNQSYLAWCADLFGEFQHNLASPNLLYTPLDTYGSLPANANTLNHWPEVNWVLNNKDPNTWVTQQVIWRLLSGAYAPAGFPQPQPATDNLYAQALTHHAFVPGQGQVEAVLLYVDGSNNDPNNFYQDMLFELPVPPPPGTGCPATKGFWHDPSKHLWPDVKINVDGVEYNFLGDHGMTIGGVHYTQDQLVTIMPSGGSATGGNGFVIAGSQLIAAVLNIAAGAQHSSSVDTTISNLNTALHLQNILGPTPPDPLNSELKAFGDALDTYNSATGLNCTEASGLTLGVKVKH